MSQPFFGATYLPLNLWHVKTTKVLEFSTLEEIPHPFLGIEFRSVGWQVFKMHPFGSPLSQKRFDRLAAMDGRAIPDDQQRACNLAGQHLQKAHDIWTLVRMVLGLHQQLPLWGDAADSREMVTGEFDLQHWRLADWCIGADRQWQQIKCRLIYEHDGSFFVSGFFLTRPIAALSRFESQTHRAVSPSGWVFADCA